MKGKILSWDEFRELTETDAGLWYMNGWTSDALTVNDVLDEYDKTYFDEYENLDEIEKICDYSTSNFFTPEEIAEKTIEILSKIE